MSRTNGARSREEMPSEEEEEEVEEEEVEEEEERGGRDSRPSNSRQNPPTQVVIMICLSLICFNFNSRETPPRQREEGIEEEDRGEGGGNEMEL